MRIITALLLLATQVVFAQYKATKTTTIPEGLAPSVKVLLQKEGLVVSNAKGAVLEVWLVEQLPSGSPASEPNVTLTTVPHGSLLGVVKVSQRFSDRRADQMKPGLYTMRFSFFPVNGAHQGIAPQRDFVVLSDAATDTDPKATPDFMTLIKQGEKTSGVPHPYVLSLYKQEAAEFKPGFAQSEVKEEDWLYQTKIGETPVAIFLVGSAEQ